MREPWSRTDDTWIAAMAGERGQTLPDFTVGIAVFLLTIAFITVFVPQLALPFDDQEQPVVAERIASDLSKNMLAERETSSMLNESRTLAFFDDEPETDQLGVSSTYSVNITLRNAASDDPVSEILCEESGSIDDCNGGSKLTAGPAVPQNDRSVSTARAGVFTDGTDAVLEVRVW